MSSKTIYQYKNVMGNPSLLLQTFFEIRDNHGVYVAQLYDVSADGSMVRRGSEQLGASEVEAVLGLCELALGYHMSESDIIKESILLEAEFKHND